MNRDTLINSAKKAFITDETDALFENLLAWSEEVNKLADKMLKDIQEIQVSVLAIAKQLGEE